MTQEGNMRTHGSMALLRRQHQTIVSFLTAGEEALEQLDRGSDLTHFAARLKRMMADHFRLQRAALVPVLQRDPRLARGPLAKLLAERAALRRLLRGLQGAARTADRRKQHACAVDLVGVLVLHLAKQEAVLFGVVPALHADPLRQVKFRAAALGRSSEIPSAALRMMVPHLRTA